MRCPFCPQTLGKNSKVVATHKSEDGTSITRRRECLDDESHRFWTIERYSKAVVVKSDGSSEPFEREKLTRAISLAAKTLTPGDIDDLVDDVHQRILRGGAMTTSDVGEYVLDKLREQDEVAWVRFASVFENFKTIDQFERVVTTYKREQRKVAKRDGRTVAFQREKLARGLHAATQRLDVDPRAVDLAVERIDQQVLRGETVSFERLGQLALDELRDLHPVAWMRFASIHKGFTSLKEFEDAALRLHAQERQK